MKKFISLLISLVALYATPVFAEEQTCTIMFEYTGTDDEITALVDLFLNEMESGVIIQYKGYEYVAFCESMDKCTVVPGNIRVVATDKHEGT